MRHLGVGQLIFAVIAKKLKAAGNFCKDRFSNARRYPQEAGWQEIHGWMGAGQIW